MSSQTSGIRSQRSSTLNWFSRVPTIYQKFSAGNNADDSNGIVATVGVWALALSVNNSLY